MATLDVSKWGYIVGAPSATALGARNATFGTATSNPTSGVASSIRYHSYASGKGSTFQFTRTYLYFDTTSLSSVTAATINIDIDTNYYAARAYKSSAFGGTGGSNLTSTDFDNIDLSTDLSSITFFGGTGWQSITLNSDARDQINNYNYLIVALLHPNDAAAITVTYTDSKTDIDWASTVYLDYETSPAPSGPNISSLNGVSSANLGKVMGTEYSNIVEINTVT
jgi:hypothetical protein